MLELVIVKIRGSERHDQISQSDQRRVGISKETNDYVTIQHRHGSLITILKRQSDGISRGGEEKELSNFFSFSFPLYTVPVCNLPGNGRETSGTCQSSRTSSPSFQNRNRGPDRPRSRLGSRHYYAIRYQPIHDWLAYTNKYDTVIIICKVNRTLRERIQHEMYEK